MKKPLLIFIYLLLITSLYATTYSSNCIGQKVSAYDGESKYYLVEEVNDNLTVQKLYNENLLVQTKTVKIEDNIKTVTVEKEDFKEISTYNNNYLLNQKNGLFKTNYNYENNILNSKVVTLDGITKEIFTYNYNSENKLNSILKVIPDEKEVFYFFSLNDEYQSLSISDSLTFKKSTIQDGVINSLEYKNDDVVNSIEVEKLEDDTIVLIDKVGKKVSKDYFSKGVLTKKEFYDENNFLTQVVEFFYDDNYSLVREITTENIFNTITRQYDSIKITEKTFSQNKIKSVTVKENQEKVSFYYFDTNGRKIEELYENNKVYCTIIYQDDKIVDIQYREVDDGI